MGVVIRQSIKGTAMTYLGAVLGFVTQFFIVTKFFSPEVIGLTKVYYEVGLFFANFALLGTTSSGMRFFPYFKDGGNKNNGFFFYFTVIPLVGTVLVSIVYLFCKEPVVSFFASDNDLFGQFFYYVVPLIFILVFWLAMETYSNINMRIAVPKAVREVALRVFLIVAYLLYAFKIIDLSGLVIAMLLSYALCLVILFTYVSRTSVVSWEHDTSFLTPELKTQYFKYTGFLLLSAVTGGLMSQLDLFMLSSVKGMYSAGIYTIAFYMANVVDMPCRSISSISTPIAADALKRGEFQEANSLYKKVSINQLMLTSMLLLLVWVNIDNIFEILPNGDKFVEGKYVVLFLGLAKIISSTLNFGGVLIQFSKYYYWSLYISVFLTFLTIGTNLVFIPRMGVSGAALATLITTIISFSYQQYIVQRKIHGNPFTKKTLYMLGVIAVLSGVNHMISLIPFTSVWADVIVRTSIIVLLGVTLVYLFKISDDFNRLIRSFVIKR